MGLFHKLKSGASNFFKKAGGTADNIFRKATNTITDGANIVGNELRRDGKVVAGGLKQTGNFLEKNAGILSDVGAGLAIAVGQPELAPIIAGAGNSAQQFGGRIKRAGSSVQGYTDKANNMLSTKTDAITNTINNARTDVANKTTKAISTMDNLQPSNNLAQIHSDLVNQ